MGITRYQINIFAFAGTSEHPELPWIGGIPVTGTVKDEMEHLVGRTPACVDLEFTEDLTQESINQYCASDEAKAAFDELNVLMGKCGSIYPGSNCCLVDVSYLGYEEDSTSVPVEEPMPF